MEKGLFIQKNVMSATRFNNIVGIACREADFDWVHSFITEYKDYLLDEYREDTARLAQAIVLFHQKKFEAAYYWFSKTEFSSPESAIQAKLYEIRCLFELEWGHTALDSYINTFQVFLQRKRTKRTHIVVPALNFIRLLRMISEEKTPHEKIIDKINNTKPLYLKDWLLEKMELYKGKFTTQKPRGN
ncbi:MAG: hypothetical protein IPN33_24340 [Saprospiraceae bacterium]|nr:hypothetical protein [Saprospiraceae bacterium]